MQNSVNEQYGAVWVGSSIKTLILMTRKRCVRDVSRMCQGCVKDVSKKKCGLVWCGLVWFGLVWFHTLVLKKTRRKLSPKQMKITIKKIVCNVD